MLILLRPRGRPQISRKRRGFIVGLLSFGEITESLGFEGLSARNFEFYTASARTDQSASLLLFITCY